MTLILAVLTDEYVALASDRRTTDFDGDTITHQEDTDTKTINLCGHFLLGFAGLARINGHRIERWVADTLRGVDETDYFATLAEEITGAFRGLGYAGNIPHAFLAVGFERTEPGGEFVAVSITVSNSLDDNGKFAAHVMQDEFRIHAERLGDRRHRIVSVGWPVAEDTASTLDYRIGMAARDEPFDPALTVGPLVLALRETARESEDSVGESVLLASLPKRAIPAPYAAYGTPNMRNEPAALFLAENVRHPRRADVYAPAIVCPGYQTMGIQLSTEGWIGPDEGY